MNEVGHGVACLDEAEAFDRFQLPQRDIVNPIALRRIVTATAGRAGLLRRPSSK